jgi:hypothetical protein
MRDLLNAKKALAAGTADRAMWDHKRSRAVESAKAGFVAE